MVFSQSFSQKQPVAAKVLEAAIKHDQLASAYLLTGSVSEDKWQLAGELAYYLNCAALASGAKKACGLSEQDTNTNWCTSCRWLANEQHPQALLTLNGVQSKSGKISVEQARELIAEISKTSAYKRIVVIEDAGQEALHRPAANALLRTIEEPRSDVVLIFFVQALSEVLATIISRCQIIHMSNNMYKQDRFFSLFNGRLQQNNFLPDKLIGGDEEEKQNILAALDKFVSPDCQFLDAINLAETVQTLVKEKTDLDIVLDFLVTKELLGLKNPFAMQKEARYAKELYLLSQIAKEQGKHYVGQKAVVETFVFAWYKLRQTGVNPLKVRG